MSETWQVIIFGGEQVLHQIGSVEQRICFDPHLRLETESNSIPETV
jgi:hypothetical protein